jgi:hypothetical protein
MAKVVDTPFDKDQLILEVQRTLYGKAWWFRLIIPRNNWEDLLGVGVPDRPLILRGEAYQENKEFWDRLAEQNADELAAQVTPNASNRHLERVWPDLHSLVRKYAAYKPSC